MATLTVRDDILTSTTQKRIKKVIDGLGYGLPFLKNEQKIHGKGKPSDSGGEPILIPIGVREHSATTQMTTGYEYFNLTVFTTEIPGQDTWARWTRPVLISEREKKVNAGAHKIYDMADRRMATTVAGMRRERHKRIWGKDGNPLTDHNTVNGTDFAAGFIEEAAVGTQNNTIHGISKLTYASVLSLQNQIGDAGNSFSTNGLGLLDAINIQVKSLIDGDDGQETSGDKIRGYMSTSLAAHLKRAVRSQERYVSEKELDTGGLVMHWDGIPLALNRDMPAETGLQSATDPWSLAFIDHEMIYTLWMTGEFFRQSDWRTLPGSEIHITTVCNMCQLVCYGVGTSGLLFDAETW